MEKVTGIGGFFFKAKEPEKLAKWYWDVLGIDLVPEDYESQSWSQEAGATVFGPYPMNTDSFGRPEQQWTINFRVRDLDAMVAQVEATGTSVKVEDPYPNGRFAQLTDPEGNPIELWEPKDPN